MQSDDKSQSSDGQVAKSAESAGPDQQSALGKFYGEAKHFLGGLITHPTESNKQFTILRHSHGIVFWRGPATTVALTVYSEEPLPDDRTYWLQCKGYSGKTGMKVKGMFEWMRKDWLNMTPTTRLAAGQLDPDDERAWQRDMHALATSKDSGLRASHQVRETVILRVPAVVKDGYYCVVLCQGEHSEILCISPAFRLLSTSTNPSTLRGASLTSLPLEIGAIMATNTARTMSTYVTNPVVRRVPVPEFLTKKALGTAYSAAFGGQDDKGSSSDDGASKKSQTAPISPGEAGMNLETGPSRPFPIAVRLGAKVPQDVSVPSKTTRYPGTRLDLVNPPDNIFNQLNGHYISWSRLVKVSSSDSKTDQQQQQQPSETNPWNRSILSVSDIDPSTLPRVTMRDALQRVASLQVLDLEQCLDQTEQQKKEQPMEVDLRILCPLRPLLSPAEEPFSAANDSQDNNDKNDDDSKARYSFSISDIANQDVSLTHRVSNNPAWGPEIEPRTTAAGLFSFERFGVRTPSSIERDSSFAIRGFYVPR